MNTRDRLDRTCRSIKALSGISGQQHRDGGAVADFFTLCLSTIIAAGGSR